MDGRTLKALCMWAKETDRLSMPLSQAVREFEATSRGMLENYTDPTDTLLYCKDLVGYDPVKFFTEYILFYDSLH
mgnify:CR=1 FL=1